MPDWLSKDSLDWLLAFAAVLGVAWTFLRAGRRVATKVNALMDRLDLTADAVLGNEDNPGLVEVTQAQNQLLEALRREVLPNGGSSMNDRISLLLGEVRSRLDGDQATAYFAADKHGDVVWVSRSYLRWFGARMEEVMGKRWLGLVHPTFREQVAEEWYRAIKDGRQAKGSAKYQDGQGGYILMYAESQPIYGSTGTVIGHHGWLRVDHNNTVHTA
jgi:PAS domain S-box-containing protein